MINTISRVASFILVLITISISGCGNDEPTVSEKMEAMMVSSEWTKPTVTVDGVDQSSLYQNFTIQFSKGTYSSSGGSPLWPASGTWVFADETATKLTLDGKKEVQINEITDSILELALQNDNTTFVTGRSNSIKGKNVFKLKKK